jgi:hypothetical protein
VLLAAGILLLTIAYAQAMRIFVELPIQRMRSWWLRRVAVAPIGLANKSGEKVLAS